MYNIVNPLDDYTPAGILDGTETVFVTVVEIGHPMQIQWFLEGTSLGIDGQASIALPSLNLPVGLHNLRVEVVDPTDWVRDEVARDATMKQTVIWAVQIMAPVCPADIDENGIVDVADLLTVIDSWGVCNGCAADLNGDNAVNVTDLLTLIDAWGSCP